MHVLFCLQQQQHILVTKKTSRSLDPFASVSNSYQSCKNFPGLLCAVNDRMINFEKVWEQYYTWYLAANSSSKHSLSTFPWIPHPLSLTIQQATESEVAAWERGYTVYSLDTLSKKSCIHTQSTRASQQLQLIRHTNSAAMWLIHAFPPAPLHKTQILYTIKTKRLLTNSFKTEVLAVFQK